MNQVKNTKDLRSYNKKRIIDLLRNRELLSKADIAKSLDVSFATASNLCNELLEERIFLTVKKSSITGGRPSELICLNPASRVSVCMDFTYLNVVRVLLVDLHNRPMGEISVPLRNDRSLQETLELCMEGYRGLLADAQLEHEQILGMTVVIPGLYDTQTGGVLNSTLSLLDHHNLESVLRQYIDTTIFIENDANLAALAVSMQGEAQQEANVIFIYIGEGLGMGLLTSEGSVFRGARGFAGEIAHMPLGDMEYECYCGNHGCLEGVLSNSGIECQLQGQENAAMEAGNKLGILLSILINMTDPEAVFIGGDHEGFIQDMLPYAQREAGRRILLQRYRDIPIRITLNVHDLFYQGASELLIRHWLMK
ncbi:ROK family protein [Paenibacillus gansuensis]|uniref:ROK family protein n=1 Tax=Paenibacillus gansuensis TaxID=306542 RepID=A0ABW5PBC3_9BACL